MMTASIKTVSFCLFLSAYIAARASGLSMSYKDHHVNDQTVASVTFLVSVNATKSNHNCLATEKTPPLRPDVSINESQPIQVGDCDYGPLTYYVGTEDFSEDVMMKQTYVVVTFYSSNAEIAMAPTCKFLWDYHYLVPKSHSSSESLLPGCWTSATPKEGQNKIYYWFYILDWNME